MTKPNTIENVIKYYCQSDMLYYQVGNQCFSDGILLFDNIESFEIKNEFYFFHSSRGGNLFSFQYFENNNSFESHDFAISPEICLQEYAFLTLNYDRVNRTHSFFKYNLNTKELDQIRNINNGAFHLLIEKDYIFYLANKRTEFGSFHLSTETTLWQFSVSELGAEKVSKILGVFGQVLVVKAEHGTEQFLFLGLDILTGTVLWKLEEELKQVDTICRTERAEPISKRIVAINNGSYFEIDALTGKVAKFINFNESLPTYGDLTMERYRNDISEVDENYVYFRTGVKGYRGLCGLAIWDRAKDELAFLQVIKNDDDKSRTILPFQIKAGGNKVCA